MRAEGGALDFLKSALIILVLILFVITVLQGGHLRKLGAKIGLLSDQTSKKMCEQLPSLGSLLNEEKPPDQDFDGHPDACDLCMGGDDNKDVDGDGIPDDCEPEKLNAYGKPRNACIAKCKQIDIDPYHNPKDCWDNDNFRCVLPCMLTKSCEGFPTTLSLGGG